MLLCIFALSSCDKKADKYYIDKNWVIHSNKKCDKVKGGLYLIDLYKIGGIEGCYCGECMSDRDIDLLNAAIEYNNRKKEREGAMESIAKVMSRTYQEFYKKDEKTIINKYFINEYIMGRIYDEFHQGEFRVMSDASIDLLNLDREYFIARMKRWARSGVTGFDENMELDLDDERMEMQQTLERIDSLSR